MPVDLYSKDGLRKRLRFTQLALNDRGIWYKWGGNTPFGIDCSGYVIKELKCVGLLPENYDGTTRDLYSLYKKYTVKEPFVGCLVFYGTPRIVHVMICLDDVFVIGAINGGRKQRRNILTIQDWFEWLMLAVKSNAHVEVRPINYKKDIHAIVDPFEPLQED